MAAMVSMLSFVAMICRALILIRCPQKMGNPPQYCLSSSMDATASGYLHSKLSIGNDLPKLKHLEPS
jgi:hypothetical protein